MARISKKKADTLSARPQEEQIVWKAGIYARLSADHNNLKNESIDTQIQLAKQYINAQEHMVLADCYKDLGKSGTNFKREGFERMMNDIRRKKINCVIVKDFSRFGRNYIETGNYIEKVFPFMKVRFIAVTDDYDSERLAADQDVLSMQLKNIVNELYAKDIAQRVKTAKKIKQEMGSYTGGVAPYGYCAKKAGVKKVLFPETGTKEIVEWMYKKYADGSTYKEIAQELYKKKVQRPKEYRQTGEIYCQEDQLLQYWPYDTIKWILTNPVYIGTLFQARTCGKSYDQRKRHDVDEEEDITIVKHTHEPIISEQLFYKVSQRFESQKKYANSRGFSKKIPQIEDIFKELVYCGKCGRCMCRGSAVKTLSGGDRVRHYYYSCPNSKLENSGCKGQRICLKDLQKIVKTVLKTEFSLRDICEDDWHNVLENEEQQKKEMIQKQKNSYMKQQEKIIVTNSKCYFQYRKGKLSREAFINEKKKAEQKLKELKKMIRNLESKEKADWQSNDLNTEKTIAEDTMLQSEWIKSFICCITIHSKYQAEVTFNYAIPNMPGNNEHGKQY